MDQFWMEIKFIAITITFWIGAKTKMFSMKIKVSSICCKQTPIRYRRRCYRCRRHRLFSNVLLWLLQMTRSQLAGGKSLVLIFAEFECFQWRRQAHTQKTNSMDKWMDEWTGIASHLLVWTLSFRAKMISSCVTHFTNLVQITFSRIEHTQKH